MTIVKDGTNGADGASGYNTAVVRLYKRQMGSLEAPTAGPNLTLYYKFSTQKLYTNADCTTEFTTSATNGNGWSLTLPAAEAGKKIYVTAATAYAQGDSDPIDSSEWATPILYSEDMLTATVNIYKRSATAPTETPASSKDAPADGATYTFATGVLTGTLNGWSTAIPATNGNPCYVRHATAAADASSTSDIINRSEWSEATKFVEDGQSQQSYVEYQEAWSQYYTSTNAATPPADCTSDSVWSTSAPAKPTGKEYLWRRSRTMTLKADKSGYDAGTWGNYICLSGINGTSLKTRGAVADATKRNGTGGSGTGTAGTAVLTDGTTITMANGDAVVQQDNGHMYQWLTEGTAQWVDLGQFKGDNGTTYYTHIAWAKDITIGTQSARKTGQTNTPNASACTAFSISPQDGYDWMGVLVDTDTSDDTNWRYYTWKYTKGDAVFSVGLDSYADTIPLESINGYTASAYYKTIKITASYGKQNVLSACSVTESHTDSDIDVNTANAKTTGITINVTSGTSLAQKNDIAITVSHPTYGSRTLVFSLSTVAAGDTPVVYTLQCSPSAVNFRSNAVGDFIGSESVVCTIKKTVGNNTPTTISSGTDGLTLKCRKLGTSSSSWLTYNDTNRKVSASEAIATTNAVTGIEFGLLNDSDVVVSVTVPVICDGHRGSDGATGKMFYSMGNYDPDVRYVLDEEKLLVPMVYYPRSNGVINTAIGVAGDYWYLKTSMPESGYVNLEPSTSSYYWERADGFGVVITQGIFAEFAKLGKGIFSGDYLFSMNGYIGETSYIAGALKDGVPAYTFFDPLHPNGTGSSELLTQSKTLSKVERQGVDAEYEVLTDKFPFFSEGIYKVRIKVRVSNQYYRVHFALYSQAVSYASYIGNTANAYDTWLQSDVFSSMAKDSNYEVTGILTYEGPISSWGTPTTTFYTPSVDQFVVWGYFTSYPSKPSATSVSNIQKNTQQGVWSIDRPSSGSGTLYACYGTKTYPNGYAYVSSVIIESQNVASFVPNWWVNLMSGKMSAAKGNFVVESNGDVTIKGALSSDKVVVQTLYDATQVPLFTYDNVSLDITALLGSTIILKDNDSSQCDVLLPPPDLFHGFNIELVMPTTSSNLTGTRLCVARIATEAEVGAGAGAFIDIVDDANLGTTGYPFWHPKMGAMQRIQIASGSGNSNKGHTYLRLVSAPAYGSNAGDGYASTNGGQRYMWYVKNYVERA